MSSVISTDLYTYQVAADRPVQRLAVILATILDESTQLLPKTTLRISTNREVAAARIGTGGVLAVSGDVAVLFPELATTPYAIEITIQGAGYRRRVINVPVPIASAFPINLGTISLKPNSIRLEGRVTRESNRNPIAGALINAVPTQRLLLRFPAYADYASGTPVAACTLSAAAPSKQLVETLLSGGVTARLNNVAGIAAGDVLQFGGEYATVDLVDAVAATVTLKQPLHFTHVKTANVTPMNVVPGASTVTTGEISIGDGLLVLSAPLSASAVAIGAPDEYHDIGAVSDGDGFFGISGVAGVRQLILRGSAAGFIDEVLPLTIDYSRQVNPVSFRLRT